MRFLGWLATVVAVLAMIAALQATRLSAIASLDPPHRGIARTAHIVATERMVHRNAGQLSLEWSGFC